LKNRAKWRNNVPARAFASELRCHAYGIAAAARRVAGTESASRSLLKVTPLLAVRRDLAQLEQRFQTAHESYDGLRDACETRVVRWRWANGPIYELDPLFFLDPGIRVGQLSPSAPQNPAQWTAYGFTADDQLVVERQYTELPNHQCYRGFYLHHDDRILGYRFHFSTSHTILSCSQLVFDGLRPLYFQRWGSRGWTSYTYACKDGRVDSFVGLAKEPDEPEVQFRGEVVYKEDGIVELWTKEQGRRKSELSFRGRPPVDNPFVRYRAR